ncbi:MAG TPA: N-acetylmuramic acid 6-phosphate etherase [Thiolinea sp.]|nr:N-acetylmuramic acid 6-phosphate etherase [Thiolinea sp.]
MKPADFDPTCHATEQSGDGWTGMDQWPEQVLSLRLTQAHLNALTCVQGACTAIATAGEAAAKRLADGGGRMIYCGAGSAGLQACVDGLELPGTYGWPETRLVLLLAGGLGSFFRGRGSAEDDTTAAVSACRRLDPGPADIMLAVSASGRTPYTVAAARHARARGSLIISLCNNPDTLLTRLAQHAIVLPTGPEAVAGSTRMAAGSAQKIALNTLSTLIMARLGYLYDNLMVNLNAANSKLQARAVAMVCQISGCSAAEALQVLHQADFRVPLAILLQSGLAPGQAECLLEQHHYRLRAVLGHRGIPQAMAEAPDGQFHREPPA